MRVTQAIIHLDNFRRNIRAARERVGGGRLLCVPVKANAYGHGAAPLARAALEEGASYLAVALVQEGAELRAAGVTSPILLLSLPAPAELPALVSLGLSPLAPDRATLDALDEAAAGGPPLGVHIKVDTGMGRLGCRPEDAAALARYAAGKKHLHIEGMATHLSVSDSQEPGDIAYTKAQLERFLAAAAAARAAGVDPGLLHAANSGALAFHEEAFLDMARPGIFLYGYSPSPALPALPVMELRSAVTCVKTVRKGETVSYGRTWAAPEDTRVAVIAAGYGDGLPRALSGRGFSVLIRGRPCPLAGRICMDQFMADTGAESGVKPWDEVIIFGPSGGAASGSASGAPPGAPPGAATAADIAALLGGIPYEITCGISARVPRVYVDA